MFESAQIARFDPSERHAYEDSLKYYRDLKNVTDTAWEEGRLEEKRAIARKLRAEGLGDEQVARIIGFGLSTNRLDDRLNFGRYQPNGETLMPKWICPRHILIGLLVLIGFAQAQATCFCLQDEHENIYKECLIFKNKYQCYFPGTGQAKEVPHGAQMERIEAGGRGCTPCRYEDETDEPDVPRGD